MGRDTKNGTALIYHKFQAVSKKKTGKNEFEEKESKDLVLVPYQDSR